MPRRTAPSVTSSPLGAERANPNAPAGAFGAAPVVDPRPVLGPLAQAADALYEREKRRADTVAMLDADNRMSALRRGLLTDPERGIYQQRGRAALEASGKVYEEWERGVSEVEASLSTDAQRLRFREFAQQQTAQMRESVERHVAQEVEREDKEVTDAALSAAVDDAIGNYQRPEMVDQAIAKYSAIMGDFAAHHRIAPEVLERARAEGRSKILVGVIGRMLDNGQDLAAKRFYEARGAEIVGGHRGKLEDALQQGSTRGESQRRADSIMATPDISRSAAYDAAKQIEDPAVRQATEDRLTIMFSRRDADERDRYEKTTEDAWAAIDAGRAVPVSIWTQLKAPQRAAIRAYQKAIAKGEEPTTDWSRYYELKTLASAEGTRDAFLKVNLFAERGRFSDTEFKEIVGLQASLRKGDETANAKLGGYLTASQVVDDALRAARIDPAKQANKDDAAMFHRVVDQHVAEEERRTGKQVTNDRLRQITEDLLVQGVVHREGMDGFLATFFPSKKRRFQLVEGETLDFRIGDVPPASRAKIEAVLRAGGVPVTDDAVVDLYRRRQAERTP